MKTRMVKSVWAIVLTLSPIIANAQHELRGTVVNDKGESLTGVKVLLHSTYFGTYTDHEGKYLINNVPSNTYVIELSLIGYQTLEQEITVLEGQSKFDFTLQPSVLSIEEVQVTAVRAGSLTPTTYTNLNKASITTMNYGQDLPYLLEGTPSTVVTSDAGAGVGYT
ncbi:MAG: carboxypeptidase-like regulatory domain-containing protein, partial [Bacteroidetes bacterium]